MNSLKLTGKIVLFLVLLGVMAAAIIAYSLLQLRMVDREYRALLNRDAQATVLVGGALLDLSDASRQVIAVLTEQEEAKIRGAHQQLAQQQQGFRHKLAMIAPLLPAAQTQLQEIAQQEALLFSQARDIVDAAARWRGDRALDIIHGQFEPTLRGLRQRMDSLQASTVAHFQQASVALNATTQATLRHTALAVGLTLLIVIGLAAWWSLTRIARPINQLTHAMGRLSERDYAHSIPHTVRHDEVGAMARALQVFRENMQRADYLEEARKQAEQMARAKSAFLATMSHEIRTPLNAIIGLTRLGLRQPMPQAQRERQEKVLLAGQHLLGVINDILDFSKIEAGQLQAESVPFVPWQLLQDVHTMLAERAAEKGLSLQLQVQDSMPLLLGDPLRIRQILLNYTSNAIKFSHHGHINLRLRLEREAEQLWLVGEVSDQGIGLSEQDMALLFQPFQQADTSITRRFGGTGLGLAISRRLAELMGGSVGVGSQPGRGSRFWFRVRVQPAQAHMHAASRLPDMSQQGAADAAATVDAASAPTALQGLRVLLVDDDALNRLVAAELLQEAGLRVEEACDGQEAIDMLQRMPDAHYDAVLMDMMMPVLDGCSTTRRLREQPRFAQLPIIAMTANTSQEDLAACLEAGMNALVPKPIDEQLLWQALCTHALSARIRPAAPVPDVDDRVALPQASGLRHDVLDPLMLERLQGKLPAERFAQLVQLLIDNCREFERQTGLLAEQPVMSQEALRKLAHDLIGSAGNVGLHSLEQLGQDLRRALRAEDMAAVRLVLRAIAASLPQAVLALERRFPAALGSES